MSNLQTLLEETVERQRDICQYILPNSLTERGRLLGFQEAARLAKAHADEHKPTGTDLAFVVLVDHPMSGARCYGLFASRDAAQEWASANPHLVWEDFTIQEVLPCQS